jgi:hypothetical protein
MALDLLSKIRGEIDERLVELGPLLAEHERLLEAAAALEQAGEAIIAAGANEHGASSEQNGGELLGLANAAAATSAKPSRPGPRAALRGAGRAARSNAAQDAQSVAGRTILAALEHGSHTVSELAVVTAMGGPSINATLRKLVLEGSVVKTEREGKAAWALAAAA